MGRSERSRFARGFSSKVRTIKKPYPTTNKNQLNKLIKTCKDFLKIRVLIHITYFLSKKIGVVITSGVGLLQPLLSRSLIAADKRQKII